MNPQTYQSNPQVVYYGGTQPTAAATSTAQLILGSGQKSDQASPAGSKVFFATSSQNPSQYQNVYHPSGEDSRGQVFTVGSPFQLQPQMQEYRQPSSAQFSPNITTDTTHQSQQFGYSRAQQAQQVQQGLYSSPPYEQMIDSYSSQPDKESRYNMEQLNVHPRAHQYQQESYNTVISHPQSRREFDHQQPYTEYQNTQTSQVGSYTNQPQLTSGNKPRFTSTTVIGGPLPTSAYASQQENMKKPNKHLMGAGDNEQLLKQPLQRQNITVQPQLQQLYQQQQSPQTREFAKQQYAYEASSEHTARPTRVSQESQAPKMRELQPRHRQSMDRLEVTGPPQFISHPVSQVTVIEGEGWTIKAVIQPAGDPTLEVKWLKSGKVLDASSRSHASIDRGYASFQIMYTNPTDSGEYCCIATNSQGQAQSIGCKLTVIPEAGVVTHTQLPEESMIANINAMELTMSSAEAPDGRVESQFNQPPTFLRQILPQLNIKENERAKFETFVQPANDPTLVTEWFKDGKPLNTGCRFTTTMDRGFSILDIHYCYAEDSGEYMCVAQNSAGRTQSNVVQLTCKPGAGIVTNSVLSDASISYLQNLDSVTAADATKYDQRYQEIEETPTAPSFEITPNETVVIEGSPVKLIVKAAGFPSPSVKWFINGDWLPQSVGGGAWSIYNDGGISYLEMHRAGPPGEYQVTVAAENKLGKATTNTILIIDPLPDFRPDLKHVAPENPFRKMGQLKHVERMPELNDAFNRRRASVTELKKLERKHISQSSEANETRNLYSQVQSTLRTSRKVSIPFRDDKLFDAHQTQHTNLSYKTHNMTPLNQTNPQISSQQHDIMQKQQQQNFVQSAQHIAAQRTMQPQQNVSNVQHLTQKPNQNAIQNSMQQHQSDHKGHTFQSEGRNETIENDQQIPIQVNQFQQPTSQIKPQVIQKPYDRASSNIRYPIQSTQVQSPLMQQSLSPRQQQPQNLMNASQSQHVFMQNTYQQEQEKIPIIDERRIWGDDRSHIEQDNEKKMIIRQAERRHIEQQILKTEDSHIMENQDKSIDHVMGQRDLIAGEQVQDMRNIISHQGNVVEAVIYQSQPYYTKVKEISEFNISTGEPNKSESSHQIFVDQNSSDIKTTQIGPRATQDNM